jgi:hypothetical protein
MWVFENLETVRSCDRCKRMAFSAIFTANAVGRQE